MGRPEKTSIKIKDPSALITMHTDTWQRNAKNQRKNKTLESVISVIDDKKNNKQEIFGEGLE